MMKNSYGPSLTSEPESHTYKVNGQPFTSVTTRIGQYCEPFDANKIAQATLDRAASNATSNTKEERTVESIKEEWKSKAAHGTRIHNDIEKYMLTGKTTESPEFTRFMSFMSEFTTNFPEFQHFYPEQRLYDVNLRLAGTADLVVIDDARNCVIVDWKTTRKLYRTSSKMCKVPYDSMIDTNLTHYTLQLNYYRMMLERWYGVKVVLMLIVLLNPVNESFVCLNVDRVRVEDEC